MTIAAGTDSENNENKKSDPEAGTSLAPLSEAGVNPFVAEATPKKGWRARMLDYSAHAAILVGVVGFAWTVGHHSAGSSTTEKAEVAVKAAAATPKVDEIAVLKQANASLSADVRNLQANLESLRAKVRQDKTSGDVRAIQADLQAMKSGLNTTKSETSSQIAQLQSKIDKLQRDPNSKMQQLVDRLGRLEHGTVDTASTGSIPSDKELAKSVPTPPSKPGSVKTASAKPDETEDAHKAAADDASKTIITGWVVRDVYDGVALVEGRRGPVEVVPGVNIPGAGVVKSIDRHGNGWTVTTSKGQIAYAAPARDYRRVNNTRQFYPGYRYDF